MTSSQPALQAPRPYFIVGLSYHEMKRKSMTKKINKNDIFCEAAAEGFEKTKNDLDFL